MTDKPIDIYFLLGPTASGKSSLAMLLAHIIDAEIISVDIILIDIGKFGTVVLIADFWC